MRKLLSVYIFLALWLLNFSTFAATITANAGGGDWNTASTWDCACIPTVSDDVIIPTGVIVSTTIALSAFNTISISGTLNTDGGALTIGLGKSITVNSGGILNVKGNNDLILNDNNSTLTVNEGGSVYVTKNLSGNSTPTHYLNNRGYVEINGSINYETSVTTNYATGVMWIHGNVASAGSNIYFYNYGIVTVDLPISLVRTDFKNYASGKFFVSGDLTVDKTSKFWNYGLIQCNNFVVGDAGGVPSVFLNSTCGSNLNGTISTNTTSTIVTGTGTSFTTQLSVGSSISQTSDCYVLGKIASIEDDTHLTLTCKANASTAGINYSYTIQGTIISLGSFQSPSTNCPGCAMQSIGNVYYQTKAISAATWCSGPLGVNCG